MVAHADYINFDSSQKINSVMKLSKSTGLCYDVMHPRLIGWRFEKAYLCGCDKSTITKNNIKVK